MLFRSILGGNIGSNVGMATGWIAGKHAADRASGLPSNMLVAVSADNIYGFDAPSRRAEPRGMVFRLPRSNLEAKVHQRVNVRILELIDSDSGDTIELEGNRLPITHSGDVIKELTS